MGTKSTHKKLANPVKHSFTGEVGSTRLKHRRHTNNTNLALLIHFNTNQGAGEGFTQKGATDSNAVRQAKDNLEQFERIWKREVEHGIQITEKVLADIADAETGLTWKDKLIDSMINEDVLGTRGTSLLNEEVIIDLLNAELVYHFYMNIAREVHKTYHKAPFGQNDPIFIGISRCADQMLRDAAKAENARRKQQKEAE